MIDNNGKEIKVGDYAIAVKNYLGLPYVYEGSVRAMSENQVAIDVLDRGVVWFFPDQVAVQLEDGDDRWHPEEYGYEPPEFPGGEFPNGQRFQEDPGVYVPQPDGTYRQIGSTCGCEDYPCCGH